MYLLFVNYNMDSDSATHLNHIKTIAYFFEEKYNDDISNKIKAVIDDNHLDYTINNNGVFINLNVHACISNLSASCDCIVLTSY